MLAARHALRDNLANPFARMIGIRKNNDASPLLCQRNPPQHSFADGGAAGLDRIRFDGPLDGNRIVFAFYDNDFFNHGTSIPSLQNYRHNKKKRQSPLLMHGIFTL